MAGEDFDAFFVREYPAVAKTVFLMTGDRPLAEDMTQEAFARAFARWGRVRALDKPGAWVRRVAIRAALRARPDAAVDPTAVALDADSSLDVRAAVRALPPRQRAAVVLHYFEDLPVDEIASVMRCKRSTAKVHLHRARARLAELLKEEAPDATG
jgi:RNA polymerase sigma-70 factor (ECF subfamily)